MHLLTVEECLQDHSPLMQLQIHKHQVLQQVYQLQYIAETTLTLSWNAATDNVGVVGYDIYQGNSNLGSVTGTTANITGLTANTAYQFRVKSQRCCW